VTNEIAVALVVLGMAAVVVAYIVRPLIEGGGREPSPRERRLSALYAERDQTLALLNELDTDYTMGKISPEDYQAQRGERVRRGADILREIDQLGGRLPAAGVAANDATPDLEARIALLRDRAAGFCRHCGNPVAVGDRFCSACGKPVEGASA
jgi:hypothetical protein